MKSFYHKSFIAASLLLLLAACTVKKSRKDVPLMKRLWHNTTAHYNGFFNANVLTTEGQIALAGQHKDNYNRVLDVYPFVEVENPKAVAPDMDRAIEKVSVVVAMHRVSQWTDDCYLQMGKAQFLKHDYEGAQETLEYFVDSFDPASKLKKRKKSGKTAKEKKAEQKEKANVAKDKKKEKEKERKAKLKEIEDRNKAKKKAAAQKKKDLDARNKAKKKGKPVPQVADDPEIAPNGVLVPGQDSAAAAAAQKKPDPKKKQKDAYFLKHRPCFQDGQLMLAHTYVERGEFDKAGLIYRTLESEQNTFRHIRKQLQPAFANFYIVQKKYKEAVPYLETAVKQAKKKEGKARYAYILAQLYQKVGDGNRSYDAFANVLRYRPSYEMEFNARLSMNLYSYKTGKGSPENALRSLEKMSKDRKNLEFLDQIYYAMAQIYIDQKNDEQAIVHFRKSLDHSEGQSPQRVESFYQMASLYFKKEKFVEAHAYYDSTLAVISDSDDRKPEVKKYASNLLDVAKHLKAIQMQDSLIRIAAMSPKEQRQLAERIKEERAKLAEAAAPPKPTGPKGPGVPLPNVPGGLPGSGAGTVSNFFAYNPSSIQRGKREFEKKWGNRPLEDNWRRKNKRATNVTSTTEDSTVAQVETENDDEELSKILGEVPDTPEKMKASQDSIASALFLVGVAFYDKLEMFDNSLTNLDRLELKHPDNKNELRAWYYQYLDYMALRNSAQATEYRNKIIAKYPETTIARSLKDPNFLENFRKEEERLERYYETCYKDFEGGKAQKALDALKTAPTLFKELGVYRPKMALLEAFCVGKVQGLEPYKVALKDVIGKFPDTDESKRAKEMLRILNGEEVAGSKPGGKPETPPQGVMSGTYVTDPDKVHFAMVVLNGSTSLESAKRELADFNRTYFKLDDLKVTNISLGTDGNSQLLIIRRFKNAKDGLTYINASIKNEDKFINADKSPFELFLISQDNYRTLLSTRNVDEYRDFFEENYDLSNGGN